MFYGKGPHEEPTRTSFWRLLEPKSSRHGLPHSILFSVELGYLGEASMRKEGPFYLTGFIQNLF